MGDDKRDTPPTGTAIPRPQRKPEPESSAASQLELERVRREIFERREPPPASPVPPSNPTLEDIYKLIDARLSTKIVERISSMPPPSKPEPESRPSMPVRAAKATGRWTKWAMAALGVLTLAGEIWADVEKYRGPISQLLIFIAKQADAHEAPELAPEPISPLPEP